jgi:NADH-ubiquinone oxidoreductase chain 1
MGKKKFQTSTMDLEYINVKFYFTTTVMLVPCFLFVVSVMVGMAFLTLLEHRVFGYIPFGKGSNIVAFVGIL